MIQGFDACIQLLESKGFEVAVDPRHRSLTKEELLPRLRGVYAHVASAEVLSEEVFAAADSLKIISRMGIGYDAVDVKAATKHGIAVTNTPGANADAVAEFTVALMLGLSRKITEVDDSRGAASGKRFSARRCTGKRWGSSDLGTSEGASRET
jgi:D-3-phosphoglycerate dehydrogenase